MIYFSKLEDKEVQNNNSRNMTINTVNSEVDQHTKAPSQLSPCRQALMLRALH